MHSGLGVLALITGLGIAGTAWAESKDRMIFVEAPKGMAFAPEVGTLLVGSCTGSQTPIKTKEFKLEVVGQSTLKNGKERYILAVPKAQKADYLDAQARAQASPAGCKAGKSKVTYAPRVKLCREKDQGSRFVRIEWGVLDPAGQIIGQRARAGIKIDRSIPLCSS